MPAPRPPDRRFPGGPAGAVSFLRSRTFLYGVLGFGFGAILTVVGYLVDFYALYKTIPETIGLEMILGLHRVTPVTRGARLASFFWVQSMVRDDARRALLFDLDMSIVRLTRDAPGNPALVSLTGCYHNLLRMWTEV